MGGCRTQASTRRGPDSFSQTNELNSGRFGFRLRPLKPLTVSVDAEVGSANRPFAPKSDAKYHVIEGRVEYKLKNLQLSASSNADYNVNSVTLSAYSSHARTYSAAVNTALEEVIRIRKIQSIPHFFGSGIWRGDLSEMREDRPRRHRK